MLNDDLKTYFEELDAHLPALPEGVELLNPLRDMPETEAVFHTFLDLFYNDEQERTLILGINPGRFGSGITNVAFTDPKLLETECGIVNSFPKKNELSAIYIYQIINAFGGVKPFYDRFFINSVCPLGFTKAGKNYNYYDSRALTQAVEPFILHHLKSLLELNFSNKRCICLGEGKNYKYLTKLNQQHGFFEEIIPLAHPRYIMQYRRRYLDDYVKEYLEVLVGAHPCGRPTVSR